MFRITPCISVVALLYFGYAYFINDGCNCGSMDSRVKEIENKKQQDVIDEWKQLYQQLHQKAVHNAMGVMFPPAFIFSPLFLMCWVDDRKKKSCALQEACEKSPSSGSWERHENMSLMKKGGGVMLVHDWREKQITIDYGGISVPLSVKHVRISETPIDELKRIVEYFDYSAISIYPEFDHAILRKFDDYLTVQDCEPCYLDYECSTFIYTSQANKEKKKLAEINLKAEEERRRIEEERSMKNRKDEDERRRLKEEKQKLEKIKQKELALLPQIERMNCEKNLSVQKWNRNSTGWTEHKNMNMFKQGGVVLVYNWREKYSIQDLQATVEQNGYSAITIYPDFDHAVLRKFDYLLTVDHCEPAEGYSCSTFIFTPPKETVITIEPVERFK